MLRLEPGVGGRLLHLRAADDVEPFVIGRVQVWEPAARLVVSWRLPNFVSPLTEFRRAIGDDPAAARIGGIEGAPLQRSVGREHRGHVLESRMPDIAANLERVRERIARAAERAGRRADDVLLIGVSKTVEVERIRAALGAGLRVLGENRVQEARTKIAELGRSAAWHLVGHLQTNKVKDALELFDVIHSLDRIELAHELERRAAVRAQAVEALLQVNVAAEPSKGGFGPEAVGEALDVIGKLPHVQVTGLMAIPPEVERPDDARPWFRRMRELAERHGLRGLSMGMSGDFEVAIEEGATIVRVGTAIFGPRPPRAPGA